MEMAAFILCLIILFFGGAGIAEIVDRYMSAKSKLSRENARLKRQAAEAAKDKSYMSVMIEHYRAELLEAEGKIGALQRERFLKTAKAENQSAVGKYSALGERKGITGIWLAGERCANYNESECSICSARIRVADDELLPENCPICGAKMAVKQNA